MAGIDNMAKDYNLLCRVHNVPLSKMANYTGVISKKRLSVVMVTKSAMPYKTWAAFWYYLWQKLFSVLIVYRQISFSVFSDLCLWCSWRHYW